MTAFLRLMDEEIKTRLEDYEETLKHYKKQLDLLQEDMKMVLRFSHPNVVQQARIYVSSVRSAFQWANPPKDDSELREAVKSFVDRYDNLEGSTL
jgi:hypothetical protein